MGPPSESEEEAGMVGRVDEDEEGAAATFAPGTGPAHRATPTCLRPRPSAFGAAHPGQVTEGQDGEAGEAGDEVEAEAGGQDGEAAS